MIEIEFFPKVNDRSEHSVQGLDRLMKWSTTNEKLSIQTFLYKEWLYQYPNATPKEKSAMKVYYFPAVTFGGTFNGTGKIEDINKMSGLIVLDFDHIKNLKEVRQNLENDSQTFLLFVSPSGDGLKVVVKHNLTYPQKWQYLYFELEAYYFNTFGMNTDKSGKDISRMCFLPFIDSLYKNDNCDVWQYTGTFETQLKPNRPTTRTGMSYTDEITKTSDQYKVCYHIAMYLFENKINIADNYEDWISYGYSLCILGEEGREVFHIISSISDKYNADECEDYYEYMLGHFDEDRTSIDNFINNGNRAIAKYIIFKQYGFLCS